MNKRIEELIDELSLECYTHNVDLIVATRSVGVDGYEGTAVVQADIEHGLLDLVRDVMIEWHNQEHVSHVQFVYQE